MTKQVETTDGSSDGGGVPRESRVAGQNGTLGNREMKGRKGNPFLPEGTSARGQEFHYSVFSATGPVIHAYETAGNRGRKKEGCLLGDYVAGFAHIHFASCPEMVRRWIELRKEEKRMNQTLSLMIQGTNSDAGKSMLVTALCRIFAKEGYKTAPFKSQNMALNSYITADGAEIGRAQGVQAEAAGIEATADMNPILIKPVNERESQIIVKGKPYQNMKGIRYREEFYEKGLQIIRECYEKLAARFDRIVIEGAGSPAEINLNDRDLANMTVARIANAPVIIVGDIEKGGVFASLVGTLQLLPEKDKERVIGVIINKFRGDKTLLQPGIDWFEEYTGVPVFGVVPFLPGLNIEAEDSIVLNRFKTEKKTNGEIDIAVIRYPWLSNFSDIDPFFAETDCRVRYVCSDAELGEPDLVILPGTENISAGLLFLDDSGLKRKILKLKKNGQTVLFGIGGGFAMLGEEILLPDGRSKGGIIRGLGLLPVKTDLTGETTTGRARGIVHYDGKRFVVNGYEISKGQVRLNEGARPLVQKETGSDGCVNRNERVLGTNFHEIFHNDEFRAYLLNRLREEKGLSPLKERFSFRQIREEAFDRLASHVKSHVNVDAIVKKMKEFQQR